MSHIETKLPSSISLRRSCGIAAASWVGFAFCRAWGNPACLEQFWQVSLLASLPPREMFAPWGRKLTKMKKYLIILLL